MVDILYTGFEGRGHIMIDTPEEGYRRDWFGQVGEYDPLFEGMEDEITSILHEWGIPYRPVEGAGLYGPRSWHCPLERVVQK